MFQKAERKRVWLKIGLMGPSGSGKTYSALQLAKGLSDGGKIAGIDTENGSMSLYAHLADFDVLTLEPPFQPKKAITAINAAVEAGYKVLIIDSATHFWKFILEAKEALDRAGGNSYTNWGKVKPQFEELKNAMLQSPIHIICCMRAKDEYVLEQQSNGKTAPKKVGMGAILEPGAEYEYSVVFEIGMDHNATAAKDRTTMFDGEFFKISPEIGKRFLDWLASGKDLSPATTEPKSKEENVQAAASQVHPGRLFLRTLTSKKADCDTLKAKLAEAGIEEAWDDWCAGHASDEIKTFADLLALVPVKEVA